MKALWKILGVVIGITVLYLLGNYLYQNYHPANRGGADFCIAVYDPVEARHPYIPFYKKTFGNNCEVPQGWKIINKQ